VPEGILSEQMLLFTFFTDITESLWFSHDTFALHQGIMTWLSFATNFSEMFSILWDFAFQFLKEKKNKSRLK